MEAELRDGQKKMLCLEEELDDTRNKSDDSVTEMRCDARHQIGEMGDKLYAKYEKVEGMRCASRR